MKFFSCSERQKRSVKRSECAKDKCTEKIFSNTDIKSHNGILEIKLLSVFQATLSVGDSSKIQAIIDLVQMDQSVLSEEEGFAADFKICEKGKSLTIEGNLGTAIICLRHSGLISPNCAENITSHLQEEQAFQKDNQKRELYSHNWNIALQKFPLECCVDFPRWSDSRPEPG
jgi:hypothetical protein